MMSRSRWLVVALLLIAAAPACSPSMPSGMHAASPGALEKSGDPSTDPTHRSFLVAFPESDCSSDTAVFFDADGRFVGAVAPGTAAVLSYPLASPQLFEVASGNVTGSLGNGLIRYELTPRDGTGVVVAVPGADPHNCRQAVSAMLIPVPHPTSLRTARAAAAGLQPIIPDLAQGNAWLEENRARVDEILGRSADSRITVWPPPR